MTNKKFKLAAMSLALTACVAASPLAANAEAGPENATATNETKLQEIADETNDVTKQNPVDETKQESTNETKQESTDETKQGSTDETKQESTGESKPDTTNEAKPDTTNETNQDVAAENKALAAAAPVAKAPVLMTASLAATPTASTAPAEAKTVATINGTGYKSFDEAVSNAKDGDIIEVIEDTETTGIVLDNKKLTIQGVKKATKTNDDGTDDGTVEETTVKPKLKFVAKEGQPQIAGITLRGSNLTFQNMDVNMTGVSSTADNDWNAICMSGEGNAALTLNNTDLLMDGKGLPAGKQAIYMAGRGRNELNVDDHSTLTIKNYPHNAITWNGVEDNNKNSTYFINITDGSTLTTDKNLNGIIGTINVTVDDSTLNVTNNRGNGSNGAYFTIQNESNVLFDGNGTWGISAWSIDMSGDSTLTATNNGYGGVWTRVLNVDKTCTLDVESNGQKATNNTKNPGIFFQGNGKIKSTIEEGAKVTIKDNAGSGIYTGQEVCDLTIGSATITNNGSGAVNKSGLGAENGGGIYNIGTIKLGKGVTITGNTAKNGGGVYTKGGKVTIDNSTITENKATGYGGGICAEDNSTVTIDGGKVRGNTATNGNGGGIYAINGTVTATGSDISGNTAKTQGGGFHLIKSTLTASGNTIKNNSSQAGGGLYLDSTNAELTGNTIDSNKVIGAGGGMYTYGDASNIGNNTIALKGNTITNNTASSSGGGLAFANRNQHVTLDGDIIENNDGGVYGGGIHFASADLTMNGGSVSANNARNGGGIYHAIYGKTVTLNDVKIQDNTATKRGGGIFLWDSKGKLVLGSGTLVSCNKAEWEGGGIYGGVKSTVDLRTGSVYNNHAGTAGDDIYLKEKTGSTLILRPVGDDWILDDCGHPIDGWYLDGKDARWDADSQKKFVTNLDALLEDTDYEIEKGENGSYIITIGSKTLALKAAHGVPPTPEPEPDGPNTPTPNPNPKPEPKPGPDTPVTPEDPQLPPVQDARADTPDSPVLPANPTNPAVQDAHALPQTGTSLFAALAMALSGFALTIAGAWASLLGKNSRH